MFICRLKQLMFVLQDPVSRISNSCVCHWRDKVFICRLKQNMFVLQDPVSRILNSCSSFTDKFKSKVR